MTDTAQVWVVSLLIEYVGFFILFISIFSAGIAVALNFLAPYLIICVRIFLILF